ncbi:hypothetical protein [uncultured Senegalimassilia sp.]|uniref:hypothetical protein n=1 Tax=uncultured Senegalimassilia sp. TaxID=1714350 RepID=UPI0025EE0803|nr:hypothetical protein [uncultured Senegalimassilia sp.]
MAWLKDKRLGCLAAVLLSLSLVAGLMPAPDAFGADAGSGPAGGSPAATPATPSQSAQQPYIADVSIWSHESGATVGVASSPSSAIAARISAKGGTLWFDNVAWWNDGTSVANQSYVSWSVSDPSIATISPSGVLTAVGDGIVAVTATATVSTQGGAPLACTIYVEVTGQTDARYVSGIRIAGPDGEALSGPYVLEQDLSTATAQFYALIDVVDPATGATQTYSTQNGSIASQTGDIADVTWYVGDTIAAIDQITGLFRPSRYGIASIYCASAAGQGGATVTGSAMVNTKDPTGGEVRDDYHPQSSIKVKAYYEEDPPADLHDDSDEHFVINKEYSLEQLESMGTVTATYTALSDSAYYTMTGRGVALSTLLEDAGVNIAGMSQLNFGTADNIDRPVSSAFIFDTNRYYFPNIDIGSYAGAVQVYPIIAFESNEIKNAGTDPNFDMTEATRFRLLFGSTPDGGTSQFQIKWINTLYVVLAGGPPVQPGNGENPGDSNNEGDQPGGGGISNGTTTGDGSGSGDEGNGTGSGMAKGDQGGSDVQGSSDAADNAAEGAQSGSAGQSDTGAQASAGDSESGAPAFSVYQIPNPNASEVKHTVEHDNPFKKYAGPLGAAAVVAGAGQTALWYRRQARPTSLI